MAGDAVNAAPASDAGGSEAELAQYEAPIVPAQAGNCGPSPIYIVCSPSRQVGKTLLARLLAEHYLAEGRPLAAVDLADEGPRLSDFLPDHTRIANIDDVQGQMQLFDGLLEDNTMVKVIDVSYRAFKSFFTVASKINLFAEARRRSIEPLILFLIDPDPDTAKAYGWLRQRFKGTALLPVRNLLVAKGLPHGTTFAHASTIAVSLEIPVLSPATRSLVARERFSFAEMDRHASDRAREELRTWLRRMRCQLREIELGLICEQILMALQ